MAEADARATAAKMTSFSAPAAKKRAKVVVPRKRAKPAAVLPVPVVEVLDAEPPPASGDDTLPHFPDDLRAVPNHLARSPLFAPIKSGRRVLRTDELLPSPQGVSIRYSGPQLDQGDCDVFMQLIWEQRGRPLGRPVQIVRQNFLRAIGRADGGKDYTWLRAALDRLQSARVKVENSRYVLSAQLLGTIIEDKIETTFQVVLDQNIIAMFAPNARSLVDWEKRLKIEKRVDLAKWLHTFIASHKDQIQYHSLGNLRTWSGYTSPLRKFREAAEEALQELARIEVISDPGFYERKNPETKKTESMVRWVRL
jgi:hypothetical protein